MRAGVALLGAALRRNRRLRLPRRRRLVFASAWITHFALLAEPHRGQVYYRPCAIYGFAADGSWVSGHYTGELIDPLRRAEIGTRYEVELRPGARITVQYEVERPERNALLVGKRPRMADDWKRRSDAVRARMSRA